LNLTLLIGLAAVFFVACAASARAAQCDAEALNDAYQKFRKDYRGSADQQKAASQTGKEIVTKFADCTEEDQKRITVFVKGWLDKYDAALIEFQCVDAVNNSPLKAFDACQQFAAKDPDNLSTNLLLAAAGISSLNKGDDKFRAEALRVARKSLDLIASGKKADNWVLGSSQSEAEGTLQYFTGQLILDSSPSEALDAFRKAARSTSIYSRDPQTYRAIGQIIYKIEIKKQVEDYNQACAGKDSTPECEASRAKLDRSIDVVIDAYARAIALSKDRPENAQLVTGLKPDLVTLYKQRHDDSDVGLDQLIAEILSKPMP
jgi:hypothetical protein